MICPKCHTRIATIRYREVIDGKVTENMICGSCYAEMQRSGAVGFEIAGTAPRPKRHALRRVSDSDLTHQVCRSCGTELSHALDVRVVGCAVCYETFRSAIEAVLRDVHVSLRHSGRRPHMDAEREELRTQLQTKRALLRSALETEHYEDAAELRDSIRELEASLSTAVHEGR